MQAAIGTARVRDASADELATIRALVARPIAGAIRFEGSGHIADPDTLSDVLEQGLLRLGGTIRHGTVRALDRRIDGRIAALLEDGNMIEADEGVAAAGAAPAPQAGSAQG